MTTTATTTTTSTSTSTLAAVAIIRNVERVKKMSSHSHARHTNEEGQQQLEKRKKNYCMLISIKMKTILFIFSNLFQLFFSLSISLTSDVSSCHFVQDVLVVLDVPVKNTHTEREREERWKQYMWCVLMLFYRLRILFRGFILQNRFPLPLSFHSAFDLNALEIVFIYAVRFGFISLVRSLSLYSISLASILNWCVFSLTKLTLTYTLCDNG